MEKIRKYQGNFLPDVKVRCIKDLTSFKKGQIYTTWVRPSNLGDLDYTLVGDNAVYINWDGIYQHFELAEENRKVENKSKEKTGWGF